MKLTNYNIVAIAIKVTGALIEGAAIVIAVLTCFARNSAQSPPYLINQAVVFAIAILRTGGYYFAVGLVILGLLMYGFGEIIDILHDIRANTSPKDPE
jgi:hypothetical protein